LGGGLVEIAFCSDVDGLGRMPLGGFSGPLGARALRSASVASSIDAHSMELIV
jgi:hypothetical protein